MKPTLAVDCSIAMAWHFPDEKTDQTDQVQDRLAIETAIVPLHWTLEVVNVLNSGIKRGRTCEADAVAFLLRLQKLKIVADAGIPTSAMPQLLTLARQHKLTAYDAAYLDLAQRFNLELASLYDDLRAAAKAVGIPVVGK